MHTPTPRRFTLGEQVEPFKLCQFRPAEHDRISFVWWEKGPDDAAPLFTEIDSLPTTLIAVWPLTPRRGIDPKRLTEVEVCEWRMTDEVYAAVAMFHRRFHVGLHDAVVWADGRDALMVPTIGSGSVYRAARESTESIGGVVCGRVHAAIHRLPYAQAA